MLWSTIIFLFEFLVVRKRAFRWKQKRFFCYNGRLRHQYLSWHGSKQPPADYLSVCQIEVWSVRPIWNDSDLKIAKKGGNKCQKRHADFKRSYLIYDFVPTKTILIWFHPNITLFLWNNKKFDIWSLLLAPLKCKTHALVCHKKSMKKRHFLTEKNAYQNSRVAAESFFFADYLSDVSWWYSVLICYFPSINKHSRAPLM